MAFTTRELFARLIQCEAGGEGEDGMSITMIPPDNIGLFSKKT